MTETLHLAQDLIAKASVTPNDAGCQDLITQRLIKYGFSATHYPFADVKNVWLRHGQTAPLLLFLGHTDVVPPGTISSWASDPFTPSIREGYLYGRGAADMKGNIAAFITAAERFVQNHPDHRGSIALLLTSDEEGPSIHGTREVVQALTKEAIKIDWCLVGESSSDLKLGDTVKIGRRGSLTGHLIIKGKQGHVAYPQKARNPIHLAAPFLAALTSYQWNGANEHFPDTSCQIASIHAGVGANNVIPPTLEMIFNFRFSPTHTAQFLQQQVCALLDMQKLDYEISWTVGAEPFYTPPNHFAQNVSAAIKQITGIEPKLATDGGTSDGRFVAPTGAQIVELGLINQTIHQVNECASITDLEQLSLIYEKILENLLV